MAAKKIIEYKELKNIPLAVILYQNKIGLLEKSTAKTSSFNFSWSNDGENFTHDSKKVTFKKGLIAHKPDQCSNFRFSNSINGHFVTYTRIVKTKKYTVIAESKNIYEWKVISETLSNGSESVLVGDLKNNKHNVLYEGGSFVKCLVSKDLKKWDDNNTLLFTTRHGYFDHHSVELIGGFLSKSGLVLFYQSLDTNKDTYKPSIGVVIFDKKNPHKILWRSENPFWESDILFSKKTICKSLGLVIKDNKAFVFLSTYNIIITVCLEKIDSILDINKVGKKVLVKHIKNPIIKPHSHNKWENEAVFNPATLKDDNGHVHLLYRAIGSDGVSRLGYGYSKDGIHIDERLADPIFAMMKPKRDSKYPVLAYDPKMYPSGGSWGGCEDPRAVRIDGKIYVSFNAFDGWDFIRIGVISIDEKDFFERKWKWSKPLLISPSKEINKNWVIFPEKIKGKFAILHSVSPKVLVDYVDKLEDLHHGKENIKSHFAQDKTKKGWDTWVRGVGPPPIKTEHGWLVLYHAMEHRDPDKYKLGALLLDLKDPQKIIARASEPILVPEAWYENDWKPGVVYSCGAIIKDDILFVYYGGGDKHVCVATSPLEKVMDKLIKK